MTTFVATTFQYVFARTVFHSLTESVYFASLSFFRLISLFHNILLFFITFFMRLFSREGRDI